MTEPDYSYAPIDCGFDPRVHDMVIALPHDARTVRYELNGEVIDVSGTTQEIAQALQAAGYNVRIVECSHTRTHVIDKRLEEDGSVRKTVECLACGAYYYEWYVGVPHAFCAKLALALNTQKSVS